MSASIKFLPLALSCLCLAGCAVERGGTQGDKAASGTTTGLIRGAVHGGQQPVAGNRIYLYAVSTNGYGQPATSLLTGSSVSTDANGNGYVSTTAAGSFTITGTYTCPTATSLVYLLGVGGNPGLSAGTDNPSLVLGAALGNCALLQQNAATTSINMDEVTTVALAYALSGFAVSPTAIGSTSTNLNGITHAFGMAGNLANITSGLATGVTLGGNGAAPVATVNTLANVLSACVNSSGMVTGGASPTPCYTLFAATAAGGVMPADTMQAILNLAHNPGANVQALLYLSPSSPPFEPSLAVAPNDWTLSLTLTGGGLSTPQAIAIDAGGNAWVSNASNVITELSATTGAQLSGNTGFSSTFLDAPVSIAVDTSGAIWIANCGMVCSGSGNPSSIAKLSADGQTFTSYNSSALNGAYAIALNGNSQPWIANALSGSLTELNIDGSVAYARADAPALLYPVSVATAPDGTTWTVSPQNNGIVAFTPAAQNDTTKSYQGGGLSFPFALALDHAGRPWIANHGASSVSVFNANANAGAQIPLTSYTGAGLTKPVSIALDGLGNVWVANANDTVSELASDGTAMSPATGFSANLSYPNGVAIDGSGNVWITNCGHYCEPSNTSQGSVTVIIGAATPVVTPLSTGVASNGLATCP